MGTGRGAESFMPNDYIPSSPNQATNSSSIRGLRRSHLGGVIFGCKNTTIKECLFKQLFGLPAQHLAYVKNIEPGLPLFLFNYSDRNLHGIFEAASSGKMNINPYAWTMDGSERTLYPAQVQICVRMQCKPLHEDQFKPIIMDNYYSHNRFWFELDHAQTSKLLSLLSSLAVRPGTTPAQYSAKRTPIFRGFPASNRRAESEGFESQALTVCSADPFNANGKLGTSDVSMFPDGNNQLVEGHLGNQATEEDIYMQLQELALRREQCLDLALTQYVEETAVMSNTNLGQEGSVHSQTISEEKNGEIEGNPVSSNDYPVIIKQLIQEVEELKAFKSEHIHKMSYLEQKLAKAEIEIQQLKDSRIMSQSMSNPSLDDVDETGQESFDEINFDLDDSIFLVGGFDGVSWLSELHCYSPSKDMIKSLKPMESARSYGSVAKLNGELFVFGGGPGGGSLWYNTVESYNPANNQWTACPPLNHKKGSLAGVSLKDKIFAIGGGDGVQSFDDVEMFDIDIGRWITTRSMLQKRFALAATELNGAIYAVGGYNGIDYLKSAERFDPREHSWSRVGSMNTQRGSHSLVVLNEKIYALGGFDGTSVVSSMEIFDPRLDRWITGDPMNHPRGYAGAIVFNESIYAIGGIKTSGIVDIVECYQEGRGWQETGIHAIRQRAFFSAIVL